MIWWGRHSCLPLPRRADRNVCATVFWNTQVAGCGDPPQEEPLERPPMPAQASALPNYAEPGGLPVAGRPVPSGVEGRSEESSPANKRQLGRAPQCGAATRKALSFRVCSARGPGSPPKALPANKRQLGRGARHPPHFQVEWSGRGVCLPCLPQAGQAGLALAYAGHPPVATQPRAIIRHRYARSGLHHHRHLQLRPAH